MDYSCPHTGHSDKLLRRGTCRTRVKCLCIQLYRTKGMALVDHKWHANTDAMRVGWEVLPETNENFEWEEAAFLRDVKVFLRVLHLHL